MLEELRSFCEAQYASPCLWLVRRGSTCDDFQSDLEAFPIAFVTSECLRELGSIAFSLIFKPLVVIIETGFKLGSTVTEVMLGVVIRC